jgi:hypothetical protein
MPRRPLAVLLVVLGLAAGSLSAQTSDVTGPPASPSTEVAAALVKDMYASLRNLIVSQENFYSNRNEYGHTLSLTDTAQVQIVPRPGVTLTLTYVTRNAWTARATHPDLPGLSCVIFIGKIPPSRQLKTRDKDRVPEEDGVPVCDDPPVRE